MTAIALAVDLLPVAIYYNDNSEDYDSKVDGKGDTTAAVTILLSAGDLDKLLGFLSV